MRRLLAALAALLLAAPVWAAPSGKLMFVVPRVVNTTGDVDVDIPVGYMIFNRVTRLTCQEMDRLGINYTIVYADQCRTEDVKQGQIVHGWPGLPTNDPGLVAEQFDAVLVNAGNMFFTGTSANSHAMFVNLAGQFRPDSVLNTGRLAHTAASPDSGLQKPVCFLAHNGTGQMTEVNPPTFPGTAESTGVTSVGSGPQTAQTMHTASNPTRGFWTGGQWQTALLLSTTKIPKAGRRVLMSLTSAAFPYYNECLNVTPGWSDSMVSLAMTDTAVAIETDWSVLSTLTGSARSMIVDVGGQGGANDSLTGASVPAETDGQLILYALAHLDSLSGHKIIDPDRLPIRLGVTVDAGFTRTASRAGPGLIPSDSSAFKASLDSIRVLNATGGVPIKIVAGINVDSLQSASRTSELGWWRKLGDNVRFSPQVWDGTYKLRTSTEGDGNTSADHPVDALGFRRSRAFYGDGSLTDADSSVDMHLKQMRISMTNAGIQTREMSNTFLPVLDDWVPSNKGNSASFDSLIMVLGINGYTTIRADGRSPAGALGGAANGVSANAMNPWGISGTGALGYVNREGIYKGSIGNKSLKVLVHNGYPINGSRGIMIFAGADSVGGPWSNCLADSGWRDLLFDELGRTWMGLCFKTDNNSDWVPPTSDETTPGSVGFSVSYSFYAQALDQQVSHVDRVVWPQSASIRKFNVADFAGNPSGPPPRLAWHVLKSLKNGFDAINGANGRTVIEFDWPENITPWR